MSKIASFAMFSNSIDDMSYVLHACAANMTSCPHIHASEQGKVIGLMLVGQEAGG